MAKRHSGFHILALAAIIGGILRLIEPWMDRALHGAALHTYYVVIDVFLILGFIAFGMAAGKLGKAGAAIGAIGLLMIRIGAATGAALYQPGAALALFGAAFVGVDILQRRGKSRLAAVLFVAALVLGLAALLPQTTMPAAFAAGIAFGLGFVIQGIALL
ncbi:MAG TPA: hypothetical protein VIM56_01230 [Rhizomicrobium sp.]